MGSISQDEQPLRLFLFDTPRTNCQAFYKLFSQHPDLAWGGFYHGLAAAALYGPERIQQHLRHGAAAEAAQIEWGTKFPSMNSETYESGNKNLVTAMKSADDAGKTFFGKEHCINLLKHDIIFKGLRGDPFDAPAPMTANPTVIPDDYLNSYTPVMTIRHPILMVDSIYRCQLPIMGQLPTDEDFEAMGTLRWCRILFDYYKARGHTPALVEAVDYIWNTKPTLDKLCQVIGIDPAGVKETWDPLPQEFFPDNHVAIAFTGHMMRSHGIERKGTEVRFIAEQWLPKGGVTNARVAC